LLRPHVPQGREQGQRYGLGVGSKPGVALLGGYFAFWFPGDSFPGAAVMVGVWTMGELLGAVFAGGTEPEAAVTGG
jgi:hypothetical protein